GARPASVGGWRDAHRRKYKLRRMSSFLAVVVVVDERIDLGLKVAGQIVVLEQDAVLEGLVPALDLALGLGMIGRSAHMGHALLIEPFGEIAGYVAGTIVAQ